MAFNETSFFALILLYYILYHVTGCLLLFFFRGVEMGGNWGLCQDGKKLSLMHKVIWGKQQTHPLLGDGSWVYFLLGGLKPLSDLEPYHPHW